MNKAYANRGTHLEQIINKTNIYYVTNNIAYIYKKPTPIVVVNVDYPSRNKAMITKAYYKIPSTTDYNGLYNGYYIDFEAKETNNKTAFSLSLIHKHQLEHLINIDNNKGIAFIIIRFSYYDEIYLLTIKKMIEFIKSYNRKSIQYSWIKQHAHLIEESIYPTIDYIKIVNKLIRGYINGRNQSL